MKQFLITVAGVLVGLIVFLFVGPFLLLSMLAASVHGPAQPSHMVLALDLREPMTDQRPDTPFASFSGRQSLLDTLARIDSARTDPSVEGIFVRANTSGMQPAQAEELRTATQASKGLQRYAPAAYQMLLDYPNSKPAGTEEVFRWAQINAHGTPTFTLTHSAFVPDGNAWVVVQRMYYVSTGFNSVQAVAGLMPVEGGTVVGYTNRTSTDQVAGFGGGTKRSIGSKLLESQLEALFKKAQAAAKK